MDKDKAKLATDRFAWRTFAEQLVGICEEFLSAQKTIDQSGFMDNYEDAARARKVQATALSDMRKVIADYRTNGPESQS